MVHEILVFSNLGQNHSHDAGLHPNSIHAGIKAVLQTHPVYETLGLAVKQPAWVLVATEIGWEVQVLLWKGKTINQARESCCAWLALTARHQISGELSHVTRDCSTNMRSGEHFNTESALFITFFFFTITSFFNMEKKTQTSNTFSLLPALLLLIMLLLSPSAGCNILEGTQSLFSETSFFTNLKLREQSVNFPTLPFSSLCFLEVHAGLLFPKLRKKAEDPGQSYKYLI